MPDDPDATADEADRLIADLRAIRRRVVNVVGHELRTPVTTIHGLARRLVDADSLEEVTAELAPALLRNARRLERLLDDILIAAGVETALPVGRPQDVDPTRAARRVWAQLRQPHELAIEVADDAGAEAAPRVSVVPQSLDRILEGVLDNAVRYGTEPPALTVRRCDDGAVEIAVSSPGPDLAEQELRFASEPFYRGEAAVTAAPGLGVGLAVARALARQSGGQLRLDPRPQGGTITRIRLPGAGP